MCYIFLSGRRKYRMKQRASEQLRRMFIPFIPFIFILFNCFYSSKGSAEDATTSYSEVDLFSPTPFHLNPRISHLGDVVTLSSKNCTGTGDGSEGSLTCQQNYSNGDSLILTIDYETFGNEFKGQTWISSRDASGHEEETKTIRHKIRHVYLGKQKMKQAEFFDIVRQSSLGKIIREIFLYEYYLENQEIKTATWALYQEIGHSSSASLSHYAFMANDADGNPLIARVDRYQDGVKVKELYHWDRIQDGFQTFDPAAWKQWKDRVLSGRP